MTSSTQKQQGPHPTDPVELAGRSAPSRVMFGPHETNLGSGRALSDRHVAYYARRAAGGAGIVVTETASVHGSDWPYERAPMAADSGPGWAAVARACRPHGSLVVAALGHSGSQGSSAYSQQPLWAPSRVADVASREMPMEMEQPEIDQVVRGFGVAAALAVECGTDGVEINAGQHSLLRQFLSGLTNLREDAYGTDRTALLREVLTSVRRQIGADRVLGLRLSCDELAPWAGIRPEEAALIARGVASDVDYLVVVRGSAMGTSATRPDAHADPGFNSELCRAVRSAVDGGCAVVLQGSVVDTGQAEWALADGVADLVEMTRAQIADPELVRKLSEGRADRIRPCVLANQRCQVRDSRNPVVSCTGEPRSGHEREDPPVEGTTRASREVLVVGGGPAGLETARVLALRGTRVRLVERADRLGGMLTTAARVPGHERLGRLADWLGSEVRRLGVDITLGTEVSAAELERAAAEGGLVLATGSVPGPRDYTVHGGAVVVDAVDVLRSAGRGAADDTLPVGPVAVYDTVGDAVGTGVAELLAAAGRTTTIITRDQVVGTQLAITGDLAPANTRLRQAGVIQARRSVLREAGPGHLVISDAITGVRGRVECAALVHCGHRLPDPVPAPRGAVVAGDRVAPRTVYEALLEGRRAALTLCDAPVHELDAPVHELQEAR
ncbi:mycofactocin system FadH/OYE family oxidoreductase 1 [Streptomyces sp. NPDC001530]|uniref:mycofactocin system FadH/OYE family oxidoreductase 1 n=1 Tax=Streptomyces sp. NPDC001530 TaxID=3364582 RepID=UPI0036CBB2CC